MKRFFLVFFSLATVLTFACAVASQTRPNRPCRGPFLNLFKSAQTATEGDNVVFNAAIDLPEFDHAGLSYNWSAFPKGKIAFDGKTPTATLDTNGLGGHEVIITGEAWPVEGCTQSTSVSLMVRRKPPYTKADDFWWWFQLNATVLRAYNDDVYLDRIAELRDKLREVDRNLTIKVKPPIPEGSFHQVIVGYRGKPYNEKRIKDFVRRAPTVASFLVLISKQ